MTFRRTDSGLSNFHLFAKVDTIVFTEGGNESYTFDDVFDDKYNSVSPDISFWSNLFRIYSPMKKVTFRAVGSKKTLCEIADGILAGTITNVYVVMDRDHDKIKGCLKNAPGIFYTFGYSWENDVYSPYTCEEIFYTLCSTDRNATNISTEITSLFSQLKRDLRWAVYLDILLSHHNLSFIPRRKYEQFIIVDSDNFGKPAINRSRMLKILKEIKKNKSSKIHLAKKIQFCPFNDCFGHFIAGFSYKMILYFLRLYNNNFMTIPKMYADQIAIKIFADNLQKDQLSQHYNYYERQFASV